jgi:hypothetical protein
LTRLWRFEAEFEVVSVGGVVPPYSEFKVDEDLAVGTEPYTEPLKTFNVTPLISVELFVPFVPLE